MLVPVRTRGRGVLVGGIKVDVGGMLVNVGNGVNVGHGVEVTVGGMAVGVKVGMDTKVA